MTTATHEPAVVLDDEHEADFIRRAIDAVNARDLVPVPAGTIVVGDDGSDSALHSLESALVVAERFATGVVVVQSWTIDSSIGELSDHRGYMRSFGEVTQLLRARLSALRGPVTTAHPAVAVEFRAILAPPVDALVDLSRDALMLVLGSRGLGAVGGLMLGSVSSQCLRRAQCPVLVVPHLTLGIRATRATTS